MAKESQLLRAGVHPTIQNVDSITATEKAIIIPNGTRKFSLQLGEDLTVAWKYAYGSTETASKFVDIAAGGLLVEEGLCTSGLIIYVLQSSGGNLEFQAVTWAGPTL